MIVTSVILTLKVLVNYLLLCDCHGKSSCVKGSESNRTGQNTTVVFSCSKKEQFTPTNGFKSLHRKLKTNWKVTV